MVAAPERRTLHAPLRVLLVEDSEDDALLLRRELERGGYEITGERVETSEAMRAALAASSWDVILSDYRMPRLSASEALKVWRASGSDAPFIVVSGMVGEETAVETMRAGAHDYVMKDNLARLGAIVERSLREVREKRDLERAERELRRRDAILDAVRFAADQFLGEAAGWEESVRTVLRRLGEATEASRAYIFESYTDEDGELWGTMRFEWIAEGVPSQMSNPTIQAIAYRTAGYGRWIETLSRGELVYGHTREFPEGERWALQEQDILSIVVVPIFVEGRLWGHIGFDECSEEREWSSAEVGALGAAAGTLGAAIRRRRTEERLRQSEEELRAVFGAMSDVILVLDGEGRYLKVAPTTFSWLYRPPEELIGKTVHDTFPREQADRILDSIRQALKTRRRVDFEYSLTVGGEEMWFAATISPMTEDSVVAVAGDITERKKDEEALARSESRLRTIVQTEPECVKVLGMDGSLLEMNPAGLSMIEADSLEQVRGKSVYDYIAREHRADFVELTERVLRGGSGTLEFELVGLKGTRRWLDTNAVPLRASGGEISGLLAITRDVTERKEAEKGLQEAEFRYRTLVERIPATIYIQMPQFSGANAYSVAYMSPQVEKILGHPAQRFVEDPKFWNSVTHPEDLERMEAETSRTDQTGGPFAMEYRMLHKDGGYRWIRDEAVLVSDEQDNPLYWQGVFSDVTERVKSEEASRESEERFRGAFDSAAIGMALVGPDGRWLRVNQPLCDIVGYPEPELLDLTFQDITHPDDLDADLRQVERVLRGEIRTFQMEKRYLHKEGHVVWIRLSVSLVRDHENNPLYFISQMEDINERKRAEEEVRESQRALATLMSNLPGMAYRCRNDPDWTMELVSEGSLELTGYSPDDLVGNRQISYGGLIHPDDSEMVWNAVQAAIETASPFQVTYRIVPASGTEKWVWEQGRGVFAADGTLLAVEGFIADVTERRRSEASLKESERLYRAVVEQATENIFLIDVESRRIVESNAAFRQALGYSEEELHRMTLYDVVAAGRESVDANILSVVEHGRPSVGERKYRRKDGSSLEVEVSASIIVRDGRETLCAVAHDITERARMQRLLEERVSTLSGIAANLTLDVPVENTLDVLAKSVVGASTAVACGVLLVGEKSDSVNLFGSYGLPDGYTASLREAYRIGAQSPSLEAFRTRQPVLVQDLRRFILADPRYTPIHSFVRGVAWDIVYSLPLVYRGRALGAIFFCFLPEEEPGEDERVFLRAVADQAAVAVENVRLFAEARGKAALEERQRLARELHDSVSQALYGISLGVETARELMISEPERATEPLDYTAALAEAGMTEMRALIFELRPESLEKEGLVAALEKQAAALEARHGIRVKANLCEEPNTPPESKETLYRIAQEALHNVVKHARASNVEIAMTCGPEHITLEVSDDGVGFDARDDFPGHLGLRSMRERASRPGGTLEVRSSPDKGSRIIARLPIQKPGNLKPSRQ